MSQSLRVVAAMLALDTFTVGALAESADAKPATVRTVLARRKADVEIVGVEPVARRGGRPKLYRLRPERREALAAELHNVTSALGGPTVGEPPPVDPSVVTALDLLVRRFPEARGPARRDLIDMASVSVEVARRRRSNDVITMAVICLAEALLELALLEEGVANGQTPDALSVQHVADGIWQAEDSLSSSAAPPRLVGDLFRRVLTGPAARLLVDAMTKDCVVEEAEPLPARPPTTGITGDLASAFPAATRKYGVREVETAVSRVRAAASTFLAA